MGRNDKVSDKNCTRCGKPASFTIKNPATTLYYCETHYFQEPTVSTKNAPNPNTDSELDKILAEHWSDLRVVESGSPGTRSNAHRKAKRRLEALIAARVEEAERNIELYYLEKLCKVYDDINTGVAKKQSNSTYYINKAIHTEEEIKSIKALQSREQDKV